MTIGKAFVAASLIGMAATAAICGSLTSSPSPAAAPPSTPSPATGCLAYDKPVTLIGRLEAVRAHFDGNATVPAYYLLRLTMPICTKGDDYSDPERGISKLQLWDFQSRTPPPTNRLVQVTGTLLHAENIHQQTAVLIDEPVVR